MAGRFVGKRVVITGASAGIGAAAARRFAAEGPQLVLAARGRPALEHISSQIEQIAPQAFLQPISSADAVSTAVLACAHDGRAERTAPPHAGTLCTLGYVFPRARRLLRPVIAWRGRRKKQQFINSKRRAEGVG